jgi:hypothetical protein
VKFPARSALPLLVPALATVLLMLAGCYYPPDASQGYAPPPNGTTYVSADAGSYIPPPQPGIPTSLVIVMPDDSTAADYETQREQIVSYLIDRGYISSESELIGDPDEATRVVRAIVSGGGFTLSVFSRDTQVATPIGLETTDLFFPEDPYFIWDFTYVGEIGRRRLPARPPSYRPHPRPPGSVTMPHHQPPDFAHHWPRSGNGTGNHPPYGSHPGNPSQGRPTNPGNHPGNPPGNPPHQPGNPPPPDHHRPGGPETTGHPSNTPPGNGSGHPAPKNESGGGHPSTPNPPHPPAPTVPTGAAAGHPPTRGETGNNHPPTNNPPRPPAQTTPAAPHNNPPAPIDDHSRGRTPEPPRPANGQSNNPPPPNSTYHQPNFVPNNRPPPPPPKSMPPPSHERSSPPPPPPKSPPAADDKKAQN